MTRIQRLDPTTAGRIAAGEVIERPASVVKELIDNALDAGSTRIDIELQNGGRRLIQVSDNGSGLYPEEAALALQRFTTSKIRQMEDLQALSTLGFRGEALPSMAAVATVEMFTRPADRHEGVVVTSQDQGDPLLRPIGCPVGTRVSVHQLFRHVPVRLRGLKSISRETQHIQDMVAHYGLAHPSVTFHLRHDGRRLLFAQGCNDLRQRLPLVVGRELAAHMLPVQLSGVDMWVGGFIGTPVMTRATRQRQYLWVNGRPVRYALLNAAAERAYGALLPQGRHPIVALGVRVSPDLVDVNVHPRKTEVKFLHERAVFAAVQEAVESVMHEFPDTITEGPNRPQAGIWESFSPMPTGVGEKQEPYGSSYGNDQPGLIQPLGQLGNTYVVAKGSEGLLVLDQHAAHEVLIYDQLLTAPGERVELDEPLHIHIAANVKPWLANVVPILEALQFEMDLFGKQAVIVHGVPSTLYTSIRSGNFIAALEEARRRLSSHATAEEVQEQLCAAFACRTALRAGDLLNDDQIAMLVEAVAQHRIGYTCPHGRPTYLTLTMAELERRFLRFFPLDTSVGGC